MTTGTRHAVLPTSLGDLTAVADDAGIAGLYFPGHWTRPDAAAWGPLVEIDDGFADLATQLAAYLAGERTDFDLPLSLQGTEQARGVWAALQQIGYGQTTTYGALAARVGGTHARAVGHFVGHNPVSIVVPCHRVVGSTGRLTGYAGGLERKEHLLRLEGALAEQPLF